jgi:hypothetical protein
MDDVAHPMVPAPGQERQRRLVAKRLHEIEGNPLSADEVAMFEMFEREAWPPERRRAYILRQARSSAME